MQPPTPPFIDSVLRAAGLDQPGAKPPDRVTIWDLNEQNHADAVLHGLCAVTLDEYRRRVALTTDHFQAHGIPVVLVAATPRQILDTLQEHHLPNSPDGRAAAIGFLAPRTETTP